MIFEAVVALLPIFYALFFCWLIYRVHFIQVHGFSTFYSIGIFLLKIAFGLLLWYIYSYHYTMRNTSDALRYYDDALILFKVFKENPTHFFQIFFGYHAEDVHLTPYYKQLFQWHKPFDDKLYNDNRTIIRLNTVIMLFSWGNYHVHTIFFNLLSYTGLVTIYNTIKQNITINKWLLLLAIIGMPSVLFWGSGVLKESILLFGLGGLLYGFFSILNKKTNASILFYLFISILLLSILKFYVLIAFIPGIVAFAISKKQNYKYTLPIFIGLYAVLILLLFYGHYLTPHYNWIKILTRKQNDFINAANFWNAGSKINITRFDGTFWGLVTIVPEALFNTLFRPTPFDINNTFMLLNFGENLLLIAAILAPLFFPNKALTQKEKAIIILFLSFCLTLAILIGLITPVIGAIVRYKVPLLPFLFTTLFMLTDWERLRKKLFKYGK